MAITINVLTKRAGQTYDLKLFGDPREIGMPFLLNQVTLDNSYPTNGYTFDLSNFFTKFVTFVGFLSNAAGAPNNMAQYIPAAANAPATGKIKMFVGTTGVEVANGVDLSAVTLTFIAGGV